MEFGLFFDFDIRKGDNQATTFERCFRQIEISERMGVDCIWLAEVHFSPYSVLSAPLVVASSVATRTKTVRIGLAVQVIPLANPLRVAEEIATLDHISGGRLEFGVGRSGLTRYYEGYNVDYGESSDRFVEAMDIITMGWGNDPFTYHGDFYSFEEVNVEPKPLQRPHPPIRVAAASEETFSLMGQMGYPIFISTSTNHSDLVHRIESYRNAINKSGNVVNDDIFLRIPIYISNDPVKARSEPEESTMHMINYSAAQIGSAPNQETAERLKHLADIRYEEVLNTKVMFGTPTEIIEKIHIYRELYGISGMVFEINYGGQIPNDLVLQSIRLLVDKVMPTFK